MSLDATSVAALTALTIPIPAWRMTDGDRRRPPGSGWSFLAPDGPSRNEEELIAGPLGEVADAVVRRGDADGRMFVRYANPQRHRLPELAPSILRLHANRLGDQATENLTLGLRDRTPRFLLAHRPVGARA